MSIQEIEVAITKLPPEQLRALSAWFEAYLAEVGGDEIGKKKNHLQNRARYLSIASSTWSVFLTGRATYLLIPNTWKVLGSVRYGEACLVRMAEQHPNSTVLTLDSDFHIYRKHQRQAIPVIMP